MNERSIDLEKAKTRLATLTEVQAKINDQARRMNQSNDYWKGYVRALKSTAIILEGMMEDARIDLEKINGPHR